MIVSVLLCCCDFMIFFFHFLFFLFSLLLLLFSLSSLAISLTLSLSALLTQLLFHSFVVLLHSLFLSLLTLHNDFPSNQDSNNSHHLPSLTLDTPASSLFNVSLSIGKRKKKDKLLFCFCHRCTHIPPPPPKHSLLTTTTERKKEPSAGKGRTMTVAHLDNTPPE